ncbi:two-partner secretion domain-containing protein [Leptothoe spongobia]|uniref:Filamentous hemagglutinin N-terminal domain-containing protein n=1 Tax=Leptothoe spongobia TAU-MAC 1115 TaxID=1967444 RepID=A0A947DE05_9CYAN|nr:filamentous hemagglutinin N-terminal domain-containing protein [Leptothoe spongobia]MBT9314838.1 filamentous hemagglutinin N-terminal domain-containing protein [Leptothoe spongobia TAU-MAC 1115]
MAYSQCVRWFQCGLVVVATSHMATAVQAASLSDVQFQHRLLDEHPISLPESVFSNKGILIAQISPDETLGDEGSFLVENNGIDSIDGGAIRGGNLFHSFQDFNIDTGQLVYFVNPEGIETILSRVTGSNGSNIDGLLGVAGPADLFLLNPNGITFGPNAELDIRGAFTASTAGALEFVDGSVFSAVNHQGASLLTMSAPLGVQFGALPQGDIVSTGVLETGGDLTLSGNQLYLEGQVIAGNDLTLQAQDTVTIRDTATDAFIARSGDELTIQGNQGIDIWTLQHLGQTPFVSGRNLALISDGVISGDAHFESGGGLQFLTLAGLPGNFVSLHDPIIFADGDVVFGDYTGVALKVEATGSIQAGDIVITGPDTILRADGSGSDEDLLASSRAAILRAGVDAMGTSNVPETAEGTAFNIDAVNGWPKGSIIVSSINTSDINGGDGGPIMLTASGDITTTGFFETPTMQNAGVPFPSSGTVALGSFSLSRTRNSGNGGPIVLAAGGNITIENSSNADTIVAVGVFGNGGEISISSTSGDIITDELSSSSYSSTGNSGDGGTISISSTSGDILINGLLQSNSFSNSGTLGNGGTISISSTSGDITTNRRLSTRSSSIFSNATGNGGTISISSVSGNVTTNEALSADSISLNNIATGNGGTISISSVSGNVITNEALSTRSASGSRSYSHYASNGGDIIISSVSGNIGINNRLNSSSYSAFGTTGNGGNISLFTREGTIVGNKSQLITASISKQGVTTGEGGMVDLEARNISGLEIITLSNTNASGNVQIQSLEESLTISELNLITSGQVTIPDPLSLFGRTITINLSNLGQAGNTVITSAENLILNEVEIRSDANRSTNAGNVEVFSAGNIHLNNSQILSNTNIESSGNGGSIIINAIGSATLDNSLINTDTDGSGRAGSIDIQTPRLNIQNEARVTAETNSSVREGAGGTVNIEADKVNFSGNETAISVSTSGPATAGNIILKPISSDSIDITTVGEGPQISASTGPGSSGAGGNIVIRDADVAKLDNTELVTSGNGSGSAGSILIENVDLLLTRRGSLILAEASDTGGGGNVFIDAGFAFTIPEEDNDILATANSGQGGTVDITANLIIGFREVEQFSPTLRGNRISDISASSNSGIDGIVNLDADPNPELTELPTDLADPANRIAQGCSTANRTTTDSSTGDFTVTGRGGQLLSPEDIADDDAPLDDLGPDIIQSEPSTSDAESSLLINNSPHTSLADAQEAIVTESGEVFLLAEGDWRPSVSCTALR